MPPRPTHQPHPLSCPGSLLTRTHLGSFRTVYFKHKYYALEVIFCPIFGKLTEPKYLTGSMVNCQEPYALSNSSLGARLRLVSQRILDVFL